MRVVSAIFILLAAVYSCTSCGRTTSACFETSVHPDSVHLNQPVTFNAACTINGGQYNWEFYNNEDSVEFGVTVTKAFSDTGDVDVFLLVTNGTKSSSISKTIHVNP